MVQNADLGLLSQTSTESQTANAHAASVRCATSVHGGAARPFLFSFQMTVGVSNEEKKKKKPRMQRESFRCFDPLGGNYALGLRNPHGLVCWRWPNLPYCPRDK